MSFELPDPRRDEDGLREPAFGVSDREARTVKGET